MTENSKNNINSQRHLTPAMTIISGFALIILLGSLFLSLPFSNNDGKWLSYQDALFTSTSAVCVTGLQVKDTALQFTVFGQTVIMILIQIGGLGFMTVATLMFILMGKKINLRERLAIKESLSETNLQGLVRLIKLIALMTFVIEGIGALLLLFTFLPEYGIKGVFMAVFHSISAFCNAGFDLLGKENSPFSGYSVYASNFIACMPLLMLIIIGGIGFGVLEDILKTRKLSRLNLHSKVVLSVTGILLLLPTVFFFAAEYTNPDTLGGMSMGGKLLASFFQAVTTRTAGFSTISQSSMTNASRFLTIILMFIGASPASTGGGIKTTVLFVILAVVWNNIRGRNQAVINRQEIPSKSIMKAITTVVFALLIITVASLMIMIAEKGNPVMNSENIIFEAVSAFGTVGLSMGITPHLSLISKIIIALTMFLGRVGPLTVGIAFLSKGTTNINNIIKYPEAKIMIG